MTLFDAMHFIPAAYNPLNVELPPEGRLLPIEQWGDWVVAGDALSALSIVDASMRDASSPWTWGLTLRLGLHIVGDLHQPLHTASLYSHDFPNGDMGGNKLMIPDRSPGGKYRELHALWDAAGGAFDKSWPLSKDLLMTEVSKIYAAHPPESFVSSNRLSPDWRNPSAGFGFPKDSRDFFVHIANDTRDSLLASVYAEFLQHGATGRTYEPSQEYIEQVQKNATAQIALGGYRLAQWLNSVCASNEVPKPLGLAVGGGPTSQSPQWFYPMLSGIIGLFLGATLTALWFLRGKTRRTVVADLSARLEAVS